jgi:hypothetical protein
MAYVTAAISPRAKKYLATAEGRKELLNLYLHTGFKVSHSQETKSRSDATGSRETTSAKQ